MKDEFRPIDGMVQTDKVVMIHAFAATVQKQFGDMETMVKPSLIGDLEEVGVNTEEIKEDLKQTKKKIGKENSERTR